MLDDRPRLLLIDDGEAYAKAITDGMGEFRLVDPGHGTPGRAPDGPAALSFLEERADDVDVVLLDMRFDVPEDRLLPLPEAKSIRRQRRYQGVAILRAIRTQFPALPVVVLTAMADVSLGDLAAELAAQSLTYVLDGDDLDTLRIRVLAASQDAVRAREGDGVLWGRAISMADVRRRLAVLARGRLPVVLEGETGTGKSFLAERYLHAHSGRKGPFVVLDLATVPTELIPAHLFGAVRGAYTGAVADRKGVFELADGGTLFIDEIQNVPLEVQKQLLLVLQDRRVRRLGASKEMSIDVKVVAASNESLTEAVRDGRFRPDLYMRLSPATRVVLPPLRGRPEDLQFLARRFAEIASEEPDNRAFREQIANALGMDPASPIHFSIGDTHPPKGVLSLRLPGPAWRLLRSHSWPGNLRELSMVMHNLVTFTLIGAVDALAAGAPLRTARLQIDAGLVGDLLAGAPSLPAAGEAPGDDPDSLTLTLTRQHSLNAVSVDIERQYFRLLFAQTNGDLAAMAERLLGDPERARAVRLRLNQLGLKIRELRRG